MSSIPAVKLPEMTLPAPAVVPPITLAVPPLTSTPMPLPSAVCPEESVPIKLPSRTLADAPVPMISTPAVLFVADDVSGSRSVAPPIVLPALPMTTPMALPRLAPPGVRADEVAEQDVAGRVCAVDYYARGTAESEDVRGAGRGSADGITRTADGRRRRCCRDWRRLRSYRKSYRSAHCLLRQHL